MIRALAGLLAALAVTAAAPARAPSPPAQTAWDNVARVVVIGDLHGDYGKFQDQLRTAGLIDAKGKWTGGKTHLVQLGDVPDRGPDTRKILDLLIKLEPQARKAGGYVHALIGNHEAMNMDGDLRYVIPAEYAAFATRDSKRLRDVYYGKVVEALKANPPASGLPVFDEAYRAKFDAEHPLGWVEHRIAWSTQGVYGRWILTHSAIIRIDDTLYLHGGIGPAYLPFDVDVLNNAILAALRHEPQAGGPPDVLWNEQSPLWYRGLAQNDEAAEAPHVAALLARYKVRHIVLGHTKQYRMVAARFDGAVILTDIAVVGPCDPHAFLIKEGGALTSVHRAKRLTLGVSGAARDAYVAQTAALDQAVPGCAAVPVAAPEAR